LELGSGLVAKDVPGLMPHMHLRDDSTEQASLGMLQLRDRHLCKIVDAVPDYMMIISED
jgi:hypothetical protein